MQPSKDEKRDEIKKIKNDERKKETEKKFSEITIQIVYKERKRKKAKGCNNQNLKKCEMRKEKGREGETERKKKRLNTFNPI